MILKVGGDSSVSLDAYCRVVECLKMLFKKKKYKVSL